VVGLVSFLDGTAEEALIRSSSGLLLLLEDAA